MTANMADDHGLFIIKTSVEDISRRIDEIVSYKNRYAADIRQNKALCKSYCNKTLRLLEECFIPDMWAIEKYKRHLYYYKDSDNIELLQIGKISSDGILANINSMLTTVIPLKDFPSCKEFFNLTKDVSSEIAKQAIKDHIAKMKLHGILATEKAGDAINIIDIFKFYNNIITELKREVSEEHWVLSPLEQALLNRAKTEQAYCFMAILKTGHNFVKELEGIIDEATALEEINNNCNLGNNEGIAMFANKKTSTEIA